MLSVNRSAKFYEIFVKDYFMTYRQTDNERYYDGTLIFSVVSKVLSHVLPFQLTGNMV